MAVFLKKPPMSRNGNAIQTIIGLRRAHKFFDVYSRRLRTRTRARSRISSINIRGKNIKSAAAAGPPPGPSLISCTLPQLAIFAPPFSAVGLLPKPCDEMGPPPPEPEVGVDDGITDGVVDGVGVGDGVPPGATTMISAQVKYEIGGSAC